MREKLIQYVNFLFADAPDAEDIKLEILQNTLDRFDDLVSQGKTPEAAFSLAISGIGDISEILSEANDSEEKHPAADPSKSFMPLDRNTPAWKKVLRAVAVALYIISVIPMFVLSELGMEILGFCGMLAIIAVATAMIIIASGGKNKSTGEEIKEPENELYKAVKSVSGIVTLCVYLAVSFATGAWWITWLIFPISGAVKGLIKACIDLKEAKRNES